MQPIRVEVEDLLIDGEVLGIRPMAGKCAQITARIISRNTFSYLIEACVAQLNHQPAPSLLPSSV